MFSKEFFFRGNVLDDCDDERFSRNANHNDAADEPRRANYAFLAIMTTQAEFRLIWKSKFAQFQIWNLTTHLFLLFQVPVLGGLLQPLDGLALLLLGSARVDSNLPVKNKIEHGGLSVVVLETVEVPDVLLHVDLSVFDLVLWRHQLRDKVSFHNLTILCDVCSFRKCQAVEISFGYNSYVNFMHA